MVKGLTAPCADSTRFGTFSANFDHHQCRMNDRPLGVYPRQTRWNSSNKNRAATPDKIRFSVEADGYIRKPTATSGPFPKAISSVSANATWYFVSEQRVGLGLTGDFGKMPAVNFLPQRRVVLALRFKTP